MTQTIAQIKAEAQPLGDGRYRSRVRLRGALVGGSAAPAPVALAVEQDDDPALYRARFRYLSADTDLLGHYMRTPSAEVLAQYAPKFSDLLVRADHTSSVQALVGRTMDDAAWADGDPGGIEGTIEFDRGLNATVTRAVERRLLKSVSSVIDLTWRPSHPELEESTFWALMGEEIDGRTVTRVIDTIEEAYGVDVVDFPADPNAQRLTARGESPDTTDREQTIMLDRIRERLGLAAEATEDDVLEQIEAAEDWTQAGADLCALLGVESMDPEALRQTLILTIEKAEAAKPLQAMVDGLQAEVSALRSQIPHPVDVALSEGKITPAQAEHLRPVYDASPDSVSAYLRTLAPSSAVPLGRATPAAAAPKPGYTDAQLRAAKRTGVPVEKIAAQMEADAAAIRRIG